MKHKHTLNPANCQDKDLCWRCAFLLDALNKLNNMTRKMTREICKLCGRINTVGFDVPDEVWNEVVAGRWNILCLGCFTAMADERMIEWDKHIKFFPISKVRHLLAETLNGTKQEAE